MWNAKNKISAVALIISSAFATNAFAIDGTITINGKITDTTCTVSVDNASASTTVTLPTISASALPAGTTAGTTPFSISLKDCAGSALKASTNFEAGAFTDATTGRLNIDTAAAGAASNVQVQLLNADRQAIVAGASQAAGQNDIAVDLSSGTATLNYFAQYYAAGTVGAGAVATQVDYTITYE